MTDHTIEVKALRDRYNISMEAAKLLYRRYELEKKIDQATDLDGVKEVLKELVNYVLFSPIK